ncbi:transporter substrate-binding domain-containing protein [Devosia sediminis]|uniref:Transporter substrate-binding domain-containing protein n=1 Tax=Devosia sediminis TaxID=2798801 RepID=A0A934IWT1_9HYPH|nr:transporter substrate-binding domain-containing protein [Devosia sediminis]MBJ3783665.1 transporter substrate-binding domain-containing protein [Devosia sediminis]
MTLFRSALGSLVLAATVGASTTVLAQNMEPATYDAPAVPEIAAMVPDALVTPGTLTVPITAYGEPLSVFDAQDQAQGMIIDLMGAVASTMGLTLTTMRTQSDGTIPGIDAARFDLAPGVADIPTRRAAYIVVPYFKSGTALLLPSGNPKNVQSPDDLCGLTVAVAKSSQQEAMALEQVDKCVADGKPEPSLLSIADSSLQLPIVSARADASWIAMAPASYLAATSPDQFAASGAQFAYDMAILMRTDNEDLGRAVIAALDHIKETGVYDDILTHYGQSETSLAEFAGNVPAN